MVRRVSVYLLLLSGVILLPRLANAQYAIHVLSGTVTSVNHAAGMIAMDANDGTKANFSTAVPSNASFQFDGKIRAETVSPTKFDGVGHQVLIFYYGVGVERTAVALKDLGEGEFTSSLGIVSEFDKHSRMLTITVPSSEPESFYVEDNAVADTAEGVIEGRKFNPHKGVQARVVASLEGGKETAVFVRARSTY